MTSSHRKIYASYDIKLNPARSLPLRTVLTVAVLLLVSCTSKKTDEGNTENFAEHVTGFWMDVDFSNPGVISDTATLEQKISDFVYLLSNAPAAVVPVAMDSLVGKATSSEMGIETANRLMSLYLDEPNSPMRNESLMTAYLEALEKNPRVDEATRLRAHHYIGEMSKNSAGSIAADFPLLLSDGSVTTLHEWLSGKRGNTEIIFYDPDCDTCRGLLETADESVLAVDVTGDMKRWKETEVASGSKATAAFALEDIGETKYSFRALPSKYTLSPDAIVTARER